MKIVTSLRSGYQRKFDKKSGDLFQSHSGTNWSVVFIQIVVFILFLLPAILYGEQNEEFKSAILERHNYYRSLAGLKPMVWDESLQKLAEDWTEKLRTTKNCKMIHSPATLRRNVGGFNYIGENLYYYFSSESFSITKVHAEKSVLSWYEEIADFQYSPGGVLCPLRGGKGMIGHFTQVMWDTSTNLGCGYALCNGNKLVLISCNYGPGGNFNQHNTPPFSPEAAKKLNAHEENRKYGGLPFCN